jgi:uncharacterized membrane protein
MLRPQTKASTRSVARRVPTIMVQLAILAVTLVLPATARAELTVCNATSSRVGLAIGYRASQGWTTEGWWNIPAQTCESLLKAPVSRRYIYVYAIDYERGGEWTGAHTMCINTKSFLIRDVENCEDRGFRRAGFYEVDTGDSTKWTIRLTDPEKTASKTR